MRLELLTFGPGGWGTTLLLGGSMTIAVASSAFIVGLAVGTLTAFGKRSAHFALRALAHGYTTLVRGVPELLVIYLFFFGTSSMLMAIVNAAFGYDGYIEVNAFTVGVMSVGLISGAYSAEDIRGALASVPNGQLEAAPALGLSGRLVYSRRLF